MGEMSERELLSAILTAVQTIDAKVTAIDERLTFFQGENKQSLVQIQGEISEIKSTQERHERVLELLSLKTIEHEALIRHYK